MSDRDYSTEFRRPGLPRCGKSPASLKFDGKWLELRSGAYRGAFPAVSGKPKSDGSFDYSVARQKLPFVGPIPEGRYWINPEDLWENAFYKVRTPRAAWGDYRITLRIFPGTKTWGRGGFFIHGGYVRGSAGCIDLTSVMNTFVDRVKSVASRKNCYILLNVNYQST